LVLRQQAFISYKYNDNKMLKIRLITASVLIPALLIAIFYSADWVWSFLAGGVVMLACWEWANLIKLDVRAKQLFLLAAFAVCLLIIYTFHASYTQLNERFILLMMTSAAFIWAVFVPFWLVSQVDLNAKKIFVSIVGLVLLSAMLIALIGLHRISPWLLLGLIATVSIADSAAYFFGKRFGKHKLAPKISPGKTWEGVLGALFTVAIYGGLLCYFLGYSVWLLVGLLCLVVLSVMGDLFESKLKRQANVKDSGQLLPGHGGILDRIDGLMPSLVMSLFYIYLPLFIQH